MNGTLLPPEAFFFLKSMEFLISGNELLCQSSPHSEGMYTSPRNMTVFGIAYQRLVCLRFVLSCLQQVLVKCHTRIWSSSTTCSFEVESQHQYVLFIYLLTFHFQNCKCNLFIVGCIELIQYEPAVECNNLLESHKYFTVTVCQLSHTMKHWALGASQGPGYFGTESSQKESHLSRESSPHVLCGGRDVGSCCFLYVGTRKAKGVPSAVCFWPLGIDGSNSKKRKENSWITTLYILFCQQELTGHWEICFFHLVSPPSLKGLPCLLLIKLSFEAISWKSTHRRGKISV